MLLCYAQHKVAIGTRCISGEGLEKSLNAHLRPGSLTNPRGRGMRMGNLIQNFR